MWRSYWRGVLPQIQQGIAVWRRQKKALITLPPLPSDRKDLYATVRVSCHGNLNNSSGQQHMHTLAQVIAPLLNPGEIIRASLIPVLQKDNQGSLDCLQFS